MATTTLDHPARAGATAVYEVADFEAIYRDASGEPARLPWARGEPHPSLVSWLNAEAPCLVRPGCRVAVVGCGLGDDAAELIRRGFDVTAFDCSRSAIEWAKRRFPRYSDVFVQADVRAAPSKWRHRFDLVVEINNLPWLGADEQSRVTEGIVDLLHPNGVLLVICAGAGAGNEPGIEPDDLLAQIRASGLEPTRDLDDFEDDANPPRRWLRGAFRQPISC